MRRAAKEATLGDLAGRHHEVTLTRIKIRKCDSVLGLVPFGVDATSFALASFSRLLSSYLLQLPHRRLTTATSLGATQASTVFQRVL
ncbi:hypothetical protein R1flu_002455 [Riccia fluitans]|uniref:Uncharacterized protein n=1 Tax=Riccia fluitans TaxID=41844 RepID=A0ABD1Y6N8_9MARC